MQCAELAEKLAEDVAAEELKGRTITLKLKATNFEVRTRAATLARHISAYEDILREALKLLRAELPITIRLMVSHNDSCHAPLIGTPAAIPAEAREQTCLPCHPTICAVGVGSSCSTCRRACRPVQFSCGMRLDMALEGQGCMRIAVHSEVAEGMQEA